LIIIVLAQPPNQESRADVGNRAPRADASPRITAARWDPDLPTAQAAKRASRAIGWPELSADAVWLSSQPT